ncbi:hypothetical protein GCM10011507_17120 [Edaphobacter acidisoli]|uniref:Uncharacterized protein n=1 Tax=Edaphobacter acidisoli TaxID=2040573 RepID=A0A916RR28_9BACT|nr:hypothetical protein [Edaphobacter acidisoli]GGA66082.1 hypothetical protein GCM10011507_17120 [Edaphobacter acidisoli]
MTVMTKRPATTEQTTEKLRGLVNLLNLHFAGVAVLVLVNLYLLAHIFFAWSAASSQNADALEQQTVAMKTAEIAKKPLEGLDTKLADATTDANKFYKQRLPFATSEVAGELGALAKKDGVRLTRVGYTYAPVMAGSSGALTEVRMDAGLTGDYRPLVTFINALERDKMFFLIDGVSLTGEQSGTVGLRLRMTTYLRQPVGSETTEKSVDAADSAPAGGGR